MSIAYTTVKLPQVERNSLGTRFIATDVVKVAWSSAVDACDEWLQSPGLQFPYFTTNPLAKLARCVSCRIESHWPDDVKADPASTQLGSTDYATITRTFTTNESQVLWYPAGRNPALSTREDAQINETLEPYMEALALESANYEWDTEVDGSKVVQDKEVPFKQMHRTTYVLNRYNIPYFPGWCINLIGKVNAADFYPPSWEPEPTTPPTYWYWPAKTLMMMNPVLNMHLNSAGIRVFDVTLRMLYKEETWEKFYRSTIDDFDKIKCKSTSAYFAPETADFTVIFPS